MNVIKSLRDLLEPCDPITITVLGKEYGGLMMQARLSKEGREVLSKIPGFHTYETRHGDDGDWVTPVSIKKEGIRVSVNFCAVVITTEEIPFPDDVIELDIDDINYAEEVNE